jgi:hypothetical protein
MVFGAVRAVARHAGLRSRRRRADDLLDRLDDFGLQEGSDVGALLFRKRRGLSSASSGAGDRRRRSRSER